MTYKGRPKGDYEGYETYRKHTGKSLKAFLADKAKRGKRAKTFKQWKKNPNLYDLEGVDTPSGNFFKYRKKYNMKRKMRKNNKKQWTYGK